MKKIKDIKIRKIIGGTLILIAVLIVLIPFFLILGLNKVLGILAVTIFCTVIIIVGVELIHS